MVSTRQKWVSFVSLLTLVIVLMLTGCRIAPAPAISPSSPVKEVFSPPARPAKPEWEQKWDQLLAAAKKEGKVTVYGGVTPDLKTRLMEGFQKKNYGIEIDVYTATPTEVAERYFRERRAGLDIADVFIVGQSGAVTIFKKEGALVPIRPHLILPEVLDPNVWRMGKLPFLDKDELLLFLISGYTSYLLANTELVKEGQIASYQDLADPRWRGKIISSDPSIATSAANWVAYIFKLMGREGGESFLRQLAKQNVEFTRDNRLAVETVARGKYAISLAPLPEIVADFAKAGAPINWVSVKEGGLASPGSYAGGMPDRPAHPNAAAVMLNYLLSKEGQTALMQSSGSLPSRLDVPLMDILPGREPKPGDKIFWIDEDFILSIPTYYPLSRDIFGLR